MKSVWSDLTRNIRSIQADHYLLSNCCFTKNTSMIFQEYLIISWVNGTYLFWETPVLIKSIFFPVIPLLFVGRSQEWCTLKIHILLKMWKYLRYIDDMDIDNIDRSRSITHSVNSHTYIWLQLSDILCSKEV